MLSFVPFYLVRIVAFRIATKTKYGIVSKVGLTCGVIGPCALTFCNMIYLSLKALARRANSATKTLRYVEAKTFVLSVAEACV